MHPSQDLHDVLIILAAAVLVVPVFNRLRSSPVLGYLVAGMLIGPSGLGIVSDISGVMLLAHFGVVFLLFTIGLELSVERLKAIRSHVFGLGTLAGRRDRWSVLACRPLARPAARSRRDPGRRTGFVIHRHRASDPGRTGRVADPARPRLLRHPAAPGSGGGSPADAGAAAGGARYPSCPERLGWRRSRRSGR